MKIGVIGVGVVGSAVLYGFLKRGVEAFGYDIGKPEFNRLNQVLKSDVVFVCVPTPSYEIGGQDLSAIHSVMKQLTEASYQGVVAIKSTTLPGTVNEIQSVYPKLRICHQPEFLRAAKAQEDFDTQVCAYVGGLAGEPVVEAYKRIGVASFVYPSPISTEILKYMNNCFLAVHVAFMNEMYDVCEKCGVEFDPIVQGALLLGKIAESHSKVPGPDGKRGFSGMCFIKDTTALLHKFGGLNTIAGAVASNRQHRPTAYDGSENVGVIKKPGGSDSPG